MTPVFIQRARQAQHEMDTAIYKLVLQFEQEYGLSVQSINISRVRTLGKEETDIVFIESKVEME